MRRLFLALMIVYAVGCTMGPDYERPEIETPVDYTQDFPAGESVANLPWWELFEDSVLKDLIDSTLVNNRNLRTAIARISEARATVGIVRADLFPRLNYGGDAAFDGTFGSDGDNAASGAALLDASYIVDLWGRVRRANEAALQEMLATEEAYRSITIALVSEVASAYIVLRDLDNRLTISEKTVVTRQQSLDVVETRFRAGMVSEVDVNQGQINLAGAEVSVQTFTRLRGQTENALSMLMGKPPMNIPRGTSLQDQVLPPDVPSGLPSELLERRPDILEAERRLHAQTARIGVAQALRFPQFTLTGDIGASFTEDATTGFFGLGAQLFGPLFNSGEFNRRVDVEIARTEQLLNQYEQAILNAFREVEDAMIAVQTYELEVEARERQVAAATNAAELSWVRYEGGLTSYLEVLDLERSRFSALLSASETLQLQLTSIIRLYSALGGGWVAQQDTVNVSGQNLPEELEEP